jgi:predicted secreted hydrolase
LIVYPEGFTLKTPDQAWQLKTLMADQEVDARASTGGFYYEGAVELLDNGQAIGRGYLELTGYGEPLRL